MDEDDEEEDMKCNHTVNWHAVLTIFQKYAIFTQFLAYPFKPHPLKNVPNHDMVPLQEYSEHEWEQ